MGDENIHRCEKCGDILRGHEDESSTQCRWCVTGWVTVEEEEKVENDYCSN